MEQPSFCFHACDVGGLHYEMWRTIDGIEGTTVNQLVSLILAAQLEAMRTQGSSLLNIIINTHGFAGGLRIGGLTKKAVLADDLTPFALLKPHNVGPIWLVSCSAAADTTGQAFCQKLAKVAGTRVIGATDCQGQDLWQGVQLFMADHWNIDDFEGTVWMFNADGSKRVVPDPTGDPQLMTVRAHRHSSEW
jgi:hypothetical protein